MTFDEAFKAEAESLFERRSKLERTTDGGKTWATLGWGPITEAALADKSRACELASPHGVRMTDGSAIRFVAPA
jgi:hypothetical protein